MEMTLHPMMSIRSWTFFKHHPFHAAMCGAVHSCPCRRRHAFHFVLGQSIQSLLENFWEDIRVFTPSRMTYLCCRSSMSGGAHVVVVVVIAHDGTECQPNKCSAIQLMPTDTDTCHHVYAFSLTGSHSLDASSL